MGQSPSKSDWQEIQPEPHRWDIRYWSWKALILTGLGIAVVLAVAITVSIIEVKENKYPDYSALTYSLSTTYSGTSFFDEWDYYTATDPSDGFVVYVDSSTASSLNLTYASSSSAILRVSTSSTTSSTTSSSSSSSSSSSASGGNSGSMGQQGRSTSGVQSVRITSKSTWNDGLFIFDVVHTPYGCATWPALWLTDPSNWPDHGEIDIMEAVNQGNTGNQMTLHTSTGCEMSVKRKETGTVTYSDCSTAANDNAGCGVKGKTASYGADFNSAGGGVMAMELREAGIRMWQFARDSIPTDITDQSPNPSTWGEALADFPSTDCSIGSHFKNQSIIVNIDVCGDWAGATSVYTDEYDCPDTCTTYATNGTVFETAYWEFGNFWVYQATS